MDTRCYLTNGIESIDVRLTPFVDDIASHHMVHRRCYFHHLFADIDTYFHMRSKHVWNQSFSFTLFPVCYIQVDRSVFCTSSLLNLLVNRSRYFVAPSKLKSFGLVTQHEALS